MTKKPRTVRKEVFLPHPPEDVWLALTDPQALAEWLMPNNFEPVAGHKFRFHVDPMPGPYPGGNSKGRRDARSRPVIERPQHY